MKKRRQRNPPREPATVRFLMVAEIALEDDNGNPIQAAQDKLDAFREATLPEQQYGITLYRANVNDVDPELLLHASGVAVCR